MTVEHATGVVHVVSHGPHCLDGVVAAVAVARANRDATVHVTFADNPDVDAAVLAVHVPADGRCHELWITDVSWTAAAVDRHLHELLARGVRVVWIDHHRSAIARYRSGAMGVQPSVVVLSDTRSAAWLTFAHWRERLAAAGVHNAWFEDLAHLVALADDNDRWLHRIRGSHDLALAVSALNSRDAYDELLHVDAAVTLPPRLRAALDRARAEIARSLVVAERTRCEHLVGSVRLVTAICDGYVSEVADLWGRERSNTVFALYDTRGLGLSLRRSPDCTVDLSRLATALGGGGHPAAAGAALPEARRALVDVVAAAVAARLASPADGE